MEISVPVEVCNGAENERRHQIVQWNQAIFASDIKIVRKAHKLGSTFCEKIQDMGEY